MSSIRPSTLTSAPLPGGVVLRPVADAIVRSAEWSEHREFAAAWQRHRHAELEARGGMWNDIPLRQWSRRYEYPFCQQAVAAVAARTPAPSVLDAGSGYTYFPSLLSSTINAQVTAVDVADLAEYFVNDSATFVRGDLGALPLPSDSLDAVVCVSVLEHMADPTTIVSEFHRVLRAGGVLAVTMDISLDGRAQIAVPGAIDLVAQLRDAFTPLDAPALTRRMLADSNVLTTRRLSRSERGMLPWNQPRLYGAYARLRSRRIPVPRVLDLACYCGTFRKD